MLCFCISLLTPGSHLSASCVIRTLNGLVVILLHLNPNHGDFVASPAGIHVTKSGPRRVLAGSSKFPVPAIPFPVRPGKFPVRVPTGIRWQATDRNREIRRESAASDTESNVFPVIFPVHGNLPMAPTVTETEGRDEPAGGDPQRDRPDDEASFALWGRPRHFTGPAGLSPQSQVMVSSAWTGCRARDESVLVGFPANSLLDPLAGKLLSLPAGQGTSLQPIDITYDFETIRALFQHNRKMFPSFPGGRECAPLVPSRS
jgi:hypothetical protein